MNTSSDPVVDALAEAMRNEDHALRYGGDMKPWSETRYDHKWKWRRRTETFLRLLSERGYEIVPAETQKAPLQPEGRSGRRAG